MDPHITIQLTATQRLARSLRHAAITNKAQVGQKVYSLDEWLLEQYEILVCRGVLPPMTILGLWTETQLWHTLLKDDGVCVNAAQLKRRANDCLSTYRVIRLWNIPDQDLTHHAMNKDEQLWASILHKFKVKCAEKGVLSKSDLPAQLMGVEAHLFAPEAKYQLLGFDEVPPIYEKMFEGRKYKTIETVKTVAPIQIYSAKDAQDELMTCARWAYRTIREQPAAKIGIICHDLISRHADVKTAFENVFNKRCDIDLGLKHIHNFMLSGGEPLIKSPIIAHAYTLLSLVTGSAYRLHQWKSIFKSPYAGLSEDLYYSLEIETFLDKALDTDYTLGQMLQLVPLPRDPLSWSGQLTSLQKHKQAIKPLDEWFSIYVNMLKELKWPGSRTPDSQEFQAIQQFLNLQDKAQKEDREKVSLLVFRNWLNFHLENTVFQSKSQNTNIQVLGLLESGGLSFDEVWVLGLSSDAWPLAHQPNPLLAHTIEAKYDTPRSSAWRESKMAHQYLNRIIQSSGSVTISYPKANEEGALEPSTVISDHPFTDYAAPIGTSESSNLQLTGINDAAVPVHYEDGWNSLTALKTFTECPHRAFAKSVLKLRDSEPVKSYFVPSIRGQIIHAMLADFWSQHERRNKGRDAYQSNERKVCKQLFNVALGNLPKIYPEKMIEDEFNRVFLIFDKWIKLEFRRADFRVLETEYKTVIEVGKVKYKVIFDRLDKLENDDLILIDYKTSPFLKVSDWECTPVKEPQIPLYMLSPLDIKGAFYGILHPDITKWIGMQDEHLEPLGSSENRDMAQQKKVWLNTITHLQEDYIAGHWAPDPVSKSVCQFCKYDPICRKDEPVYGQ